ncbi:hypothetical protein [Ulvibacterium marinum]|uniref:hypothetical protein n=1 Tax=Ulvibacterium marinum TaxID=2419782 RepID=UPI0024940DD0|nr:hypothetical protein [Ulvibacterium marinum]
MKSSLNAIVKIDENWVYLLVVFLLFTNCISEKRIIDDPVYLIGGESPRANVNCNQEFEAVPSSVTNPRGEIKWFASLGFNRMTYAKSLWSNWSGGSGTSSTGFEVPINPNDPFDLQSLSGDSWSTYSEAKNLAYFYFIGRPNSFNSCVAVAATSPEKLETGEWEYPATCLFRSRGDQCAILQIDATNTFFSACKVDGKIRIQAFKNCSGAPGPAYGCPLSALVDISGANALQFSLAENPCTGNLILVYRSNGEIRLRFYDENLIQINDFMVRDNQSFANGQTNAGCTNGTIRRCGLGSSDCCNMSTSNCQDAPTGQCLRVNGRPSIDTYKKNLGGIDLCGAVLAYDALVKGEDGNLWSKSRLDIVDISSETSPEIVTQWSSTSGDFNWNHYSSYAVVTNKGPNAKRPRIAWFWLTDIRGACNVIAEGATSSNLGGSMQATGIISGPFPGVYTNTFGIGDYFRGIKGGDVDGSLYVSWGEPIITTRSSCVPCKGDTWNLSTKITRISWERIRKQKGGPIKNTSLGPLNKLSPSR